MIEKYLKKESTLDLDSGLEVASYIEKALKKDADHVHICYHDEDPPRPCRIEKL